MPFPQAFVVNWVKGSGPSSVVADSRFKAAEMPSNLDTRLGQTVSDCSPSSQNHSRYVCKRNLWAQKLQGLTLTDPSWMLQPEFVRADATLNRAASIDRATLTVTCNYGEWIRHVHLKPSHVFGSTNMSNYLLPCRLLCVGIILCL